MAGMTSAASIEGLEAAAYTIPTDAHEADGTYAWDDTTLVTVEVHAGGVTGLGYTYGAAAIATYVRDSLAEAITGIGAYDIPAAWSAMVRVARNTGRPGLVSLAISAVDVALWDLKGKLLGVSVASLLGAVREAIPLYGSGGFTSYSNEQLTAQLGGWAEQGFRRVKMKVGSHPEVDAARAAAARAAIGHETELFVDANGAYTRKQALALAERFGDLGVTWFEEPVSSDDLDGLRLLRDRAPAGMAIAAGEYGYDLFYFRRLLEAGAVDVLQADASRCGGITGFLRAGALAEAAAVPLSAHCAPTLHVAACCALPQAVHMEYFHDHARIEQLAFEGAPRPQAGCLAPDRDRPGLGIELKRADITHYAV